MNFELVRDWNAGSADQRQPNTMLSILAASPAYKRVLIGEFYKQ